MVTPDCVRCGGAMEAGFLLDSSTYGVSQSTWLEGMPGRSFWTGVKLQGRRRLPVTTYRCTACGRLESYANEPTGE